MRMSFVFSVRRREVIVVIRIDRGRVLNIWVTGGLLLGGRFDGIAGKDISILVVNGYNGGIITNLLYPRSFNLLTSTPINNSTYCRSLLGL